MIINAVNNLSFEGKQRFLSKTGHENLKEILKNINAETTMKKNDFCWSSEFIKSVALKDEKLKLIDKRMFLDKVPQEDQLIKESLVDVGKTQLVIDNKSGEIVDYNKKFYTPWSRVLTALENGLETIKENFNNPKVVHKNWLGIAGFTSKGVQKLNEVKQGKKSNVTTYFLD